MKYAATVIPSRIQLSDEMIRFQATIRFANGTEIIRYMDAPSNRQWNPNDDAILCRAYTTLMFYLKNDDYVFFDGKISEGLLRHLRLVNEYYNTVYNYQDKLCHLVNVVVREEVPVDAPHFSKKSVIAFSGGVDASFSLLQHKMGLCGANNTDITAALVLNGLEAVSGDHEKYQRVNAKLKDTLDHFGVKMVNILIPPEDINSFNYMWNLCGAMHLFANTPDEIVYGLVGSSGGSWNYTHTYLEEPPITVNNFVSRAFQVFTDGENFTRMQKCKLIATNPVLMQNLRVCFFADGSNGLNCGTCSKCMRTAINFITNGVHDLPFLAHVPDLKELRKEMFKLVITTQNAVNYNLWQDIYDNADPTIKKQRFIKSLGRALRLRSLISAWRQLISPNSEKSIATDVNMTIIRNLPQQKIAIQYYQKRRIEAGLDA